MVGNADVLGASSSPHCPGIESHSRGMMMAQHSPLPWSPRATADSGVSDEGEGASFSNVLKGHYMDCRAL